MINLQNTNIVDYSFVRSINLRLVFLVLVVLLLCYITTILDMSRTANATVACLDVINERFFVCVIRGTMLVRPRPSTSYSSSSSSSSPYPSIDSLLNG